MIKIKHLTLGDYFEYNDKVLILCKHQVWYGTASFFGLDENTFELEQMNPELEVKLVHFEEQADAG